MCMKEKNIIDKSKARNTILPYSFVFDIGNVLLDFKPEKFLHELFSDHSLEDRMVKTVFCSSEWVKMDQGLMTHREACEIFCLREPGFKAEILHTMRKLNEMLTPIDSTIELLPEIKEAGYRMFYLSNYHKELRDYVVEKYPFFAMFDGGVFSCDVNITKPSPEIYKFFLDKYRLSGRDCIFFDDVEENVEAAQKAGINGVLFTGVECIKSFLYSAV